jgi:hypothetical protein
MLVVVRIQEEGLFYLVPADAIQLGVHLQHLVVVINNDELHHWVLDPHHSHQFREY